MAASSYPRRRPATRRRTPRGRDGGSPYGKSTWIQNKSETRRTREPAVMSLDVRRKQDRRSGPLSCQRSSRVWALGPSKRPLHGRRLAPAAVPGARTDQTRKLEPQVPCENVPQVGPREGPGDGSMWSIPGRLRETVCWDSATRGGGRAASLRSRRLRCGEPGSPHGAGTVRSTQRSWASGPRLARRGRVLGIDPVNRSFWELLGVCKSTSSQWPGRLVQLHL